MIAEQRKKVALMLEDSQLERIDQQRAECLRKLRDFGAISSYGSHAYLYHGRDEVEGEKFYIKTKREMVGEEDRLKRMRSLQGRGYSGAISGIYLAPKSMATKYAEQRHAENQQLFKDAGAKINHEAKTYKIVASSPNVNVWRIASYTMGEENKEYTSHSGEICYIVADYAKTFSFTELYPLPLKSIKEADKNLEKQEYLKLIGRLERKTKEKGDSLTKEEIESLSSGINLPEDKIMNLAGNYNAYFYLTTYGIYDLLLFRYWHDSGEKRNQFNKCPISWEVIESFSNEMGVIGTWTKADYVSLGRDDVFFIFDTSKVNTEEFIARQKERHQLWYGGLSQNLENCVEEDVFGFLLESSPEETIKFLQKRVPQLKDCYKRSAHLQEGFSIQEHTETCLRVLEDSFLDELPPEMLPFIKMTIAMHDIGKGVARDNGICDHEKELAYTFDILSHAMPEIGMDEKGVELMKYIIGESQGFSTQFFIKGDDSVFDDWKESSRRALTKYLGAEPTEAQVFALQSIARVLQTCDSGAYTRMGITRDEENGIYYYNGNDKFTESMRVPKDLRGRKQELKSPEERGR